MRMGPAKDVRHDARARIVESVWEKIITEEKAHTGVGYYHQLILLFSQSLEILEGGTLLVKPDNATRINTFFEQSVRKPIHEFARTYEETHDMYAQLFSMMAQAISDKAHRALMRQQNNDPQKVLHADSPMEPQQYA